MSHPSVTWDSVPSSPDSPDDGGGIQNCPPGYELLEEVGRGGMGVVYRAKDLALDRELALKFLQDKYSLESTTAARFVEEARITAQLQHPGIPPIHQVGQLPDGRPYLAMKLVRGRTLAELIENDGPHPTRWLRVFEAICQAVGYAHAHGVVHRDLKPANVMVGGHGEVQVMDWGLAKILGGTPTSVSVTSSPAETMELRTEIRPIRESDGSMTMAGSILGTPQFMPPEQAAGEIDKISERTDVFGLGAVLCVLLTGQPPFEGATAESTRLNAVRGKTDTAFGRLDQCGAEADIVALCKRCLAFEPSDRPARGSELADAVADIRQTSEERAKRAEMDRAKAEVRAGEQLKRRRAFLVATAIVAAILGLGIVGTTFGLFRAEKALESAELARKAEALQRKEAEEQGERAELARQDAEAARKKAQSRLESAVGLVDRITVRVNSGEWTTNAALQDERREVLEEAIRFIAELAGDDSRDPIIRRETARANHRVAEIYMVLGRHAESTERTATAIKLFEELLVENPDSVDDLVGAAEAHLLSGNIATISFIVNRARLEYDRATEQTERAARLEPSNFDHRRRLVQARTARTYLYFFEEQAKGVDAAKRALALAREYCGQPDAPYAARLELGAALAMAGTFEFNLGNRSLAVQHLREADQIFRSLEGRPAPTALDAKRLIVSAAAVAIERGIFEVPAARTPDEMRRIVADLRRAIGKLDGLVAIQPKAETFQLQRSQGLCLLAQLFRRLDDRAEYRATIQSLRDLEGNLSPDRPVYGLVRQFSIRAFSVYAVDDLQAGNVAGAIRETERLLAIPIPFERNDRTFVKYNAACVYALASERDPESANRPSHANRSMKLLGELLREGYFKIPANVRNLEADSDLSAIHGRDDYRRFAIAAIRDSVDAVRKRLKPETLELANELANAGRALVELKAFVEAESILNECLAIREKLAPKQIGTVNARSLLGAAFLGQMKFGEAEPLLVSGYEGLRNSTDELPNIARNAVFEAGQRLIVLYSQTGRAELAATIRSGIPREAAPAARVERRSPTD